MNNDLPERRAEHGMSQADLAAAVGVTRQTINSIERGRYDPSLELAFRLADYFETTVEEIFDPELD
jgi:putative transcriptional regulator